MISRKRVASIGFALSLCSVALHAQQEYVGEYKGSYVVEAKTGRRVQILMILEIASVDAGKVAGKLKVVSGGCSGNYTMAGIVTENQFKLEKSGGDEGAGCGKFRLDLAGAGGKLAGKYANRIDIEFSK